MPRIAIISDHWSTLQWIWRKGEILPKKRARERAGHGKRWKRFAGNAGRGARVNGAAGENEGGKADEG